LERTIKISHHPVGSYDSFATTLLAEKRAPSARANGSRFSYQKPPFRGTLLSSAQG
jgi:hypothetical protein